MASMTLEQAAEVLGVPVTASKSEITVAYRQKVAEYHPDAHINGSAEEKAFAEKMFKSVSQARKIMMNPASAAQPQVNSYQPTRSTTSNAQSSSRYTYRPPQQQTSPRSSAASGSSQGSAAHQVYNTSRSFNNQHIDRIVSNAEKEVHGYHEIEAQDMYKKASDVIRMTPSVMTTLAFAAWAIASILTDPIGLEAINLQNPFVWLAVACLVKLLVYDTFVSYPLYKLCSKNRLGWTFILGLDTMLMGAIAFVILTLFGGFAPMALIAVGLGLIFVIVGISMSRSKKNMIR